MSTCGVCGVDGGGTGDATLAVEANADGADDDDDDVVVNMSPSLVSGPSRSDRSIRSLLPRDAEREALCESLKQGRA
jgi:hypothetical protein